MKSFACKDTGVECDWRTENENPDKMMQDIEEHAREKHGLKDLPEMLRQKIKNAIHDVKAA